MSYLVDIFRAFFPRVVPVDPALVCQSQCYERMDRLSRDLKDLTREMAEQRAAVSSNTAAFRDLTAKLASLLAP